VATQSLVCVGVINITGCPAQEKPKLPTHKRGGTFAFLCLAVQSCCTFSIVRLLEFVIRAEHQRCGLQNRTNKHGKSIKRSYLAHKGTHKKKIPLKDASKNLFYAVTFPFLQKK